MRSRHFRLYLRTNDLLFTEDFSAVVVEPDGRERPLQVNPLNYFSGHVIGESQSQRRSQQDQRSDLTCSSLVPGEENSRVQAHIDGTEFSAHILTNRDEYNVEVRPWNARRLDRAGLGQEESGIQTQGLLTFLSSSSSSSHKQNLFCKIENTRTLSVVSSQ